VVVWVLCCGFLCCLLVGIDVFVFICYGFVVELGVGWGGFCCFYLNFGCLVALNLGYFVVN